MGYMIHHAIIVTSFDDKAIIKAHVKALKIFPDNLVTSITPYGMNGYRSFLIAPDGSKEGWEESEQGNENREKYIDWLFNQAYDDGSSLYDFVEIEYGDENYRRPQVLNDADMMMRSRYRHE